MRNDILWWASVVSPPIAAVWRMADTATVAQFGAATVMPAGALPLGVGDFDGDGYSDVLLNVDGALWFSTIRGTVFAPPRAFGGSPFPAGYELVAAADFDGDSITDVLFRGVAESNWGALSLGLVKTGAWLAPPRALSMTSDGLQLLGVGDFDGNGCMEILWQARATHAVIAWHLDITTHTLVDAHQIDNGLTLNPDSGAGGSGWHPAAIGDFDGDYRADIAWWNEVGGDVSVWLMSSYTSVGSYVVIPSNRTLREGPGTWRIVGAGDFDADRTSDLLWRDSDTGDVSIWRMSGGRPQSFDIPARSVSSIWQVAGTPRQPL